MVMPMNSAIVELKNEVDIIIARNKARQIAQSLKFSLTDQTKLATAVSEIARNVIKYAGEGTCKIMYEQNRTNTEIKIFIEDEGKGIKDIELAMKEGYTTGGGLGMGLPAAKKLVHQFSIDSTPSKTTVFLGMKLI